MITCQHLLNNICKIASDISQVSCTVSESQCTYCSTKAVPIQSINVVTVSVAIGNTEDKESIKQKYKHLLGIEPTIQYGPGTELKKLISWVVWDTKKANCKICKTHEQRMNNWGPDTCLKNIQTIIGWLRESAKKKGYPFSERIAAAMIRKAIANSRK